MPRMGPLEPVMGPLMFKFDPCRPGMGHSNHVNCLFSLNPEIERLQCLVVRIENGPPILERREFHPFHPLAAPLKVSTYLFLFETHHALKLCLNIANC